VAGQLVLAVMLALFAVVATRPMLSERFPDNQFGGVSTTNPLLEQLQQQVIRIISNNQLTWRQRNQQVDDVYASIPPELFAQIPLDPDFDRLPEHVYRKIKKIHANEKVKLRERRGQIRQILENLPWDQRMAMHTENFPAEFQPPAGFEQVLGDPTYHKLLAVHQDVGMRVEEKNLEIERIMSEVPEEMLARLPLPPPMTQLPEDIQRNLQKLLYNFKLGSSERFRQLRHYIRTLPKSYRQILRTGPGGDKSEKIDSKIDKTITPN